MNDVSATNPSRATVPAASAQEDSAVLRKKAAASSRVASASGSPKEDIAMTGAKIRTMLAIRPRLWLGPRWPTCGDQSAGSWLVPIVEDRDIAIR
jgi:hypothetical protein